VLDAMEHAVYTYDVEHIILDNMQFMISGQARGYDKFELQGIDYDQLNSSRASMR